MASTSAARGCSKGSRPVCQPTTGASVRCARQLVNTAQLRGMPLPADTTSAAIGSGDLRSTECLVAPGCDLRTGSYRLGPRRACLHGEFLACDITEYP